MKGTDLERGRRNGQGIPPALRPGTMGSEKVSQTRSARGAFRFFPFMDTYPNQWPGPPPDQGDRQWRRS